MMNSLILVILTATVLTEPAPETQVPGTQELTLNDTRRVIAKRPHSPPVMKLSYRLEKTEPRLADLGK